MLSEIRNQTETRGSNYQPQNQTSIQASKNTGQQNTQDFNKENSSQNNMYPGLKLPPGSWIEDGYILTAEIKEENGKKVKYIYRQKIVEKKVEAQPLKNDVKPLGEQQQKRNSENVIQNANVNPFKGEETVKQNGFTNGGLVGRNEGQENKIAFVDPKQSINSRLINARVEPQRASSRNIDTKYEEINTMSREIKETANNKTLQHQQQQPSTSQHEQPQAPKSSIKPSTRNQTDSEKKQVKIVETTTQVQSRLATKSVKPLVNSKKQPQSLDNYKSTPLTSKKICNLNVSFEQVMLTYQHDQIYNTSIPIFEVRAIQPKMLLTKYLWECYESKCMHFIDNHFAPVKKRSWFNKHTNERLDIVCDFEWKKVAYLLEQMQNDNKNSSSKDEDNEDSQNPEEVRENDLVCQTFNRRNSLSSMVKKQQNKKSLKDERENKFIQPNPNQVLQGKLKNCYLLSALSSLSKRDSLITRIVGNNEKNDFGLFSVWLNINGLWDEYVIDDYIPVEIDHENLDENGEPKFSPVFSKFGKFGEEALWVILIEKAYAKAFGGYQRIDLGDPTCALRDLTGAPVTRIDFAYVHYLFREVEALQHQIDQKSAKYQLYQLRDDLKKELENKIKIICEKLISSIRLGHIICCYTLNQEQMVTGHNELEANLQNYDSNQPDGRDQTFNQRVSKSGIVYNHAYSVLNTCTLEKKVKGKYDYGCGFEEEWQIIKLRNPWGKVEWNGAWSHGSTMWDLVRRGDIRVKSQADIELRSFDQRPDTEDEELKIKKEIESNESQGIFWMETTDFIKNFAGFSVCEVELDNVYTSLEFDPQPMIRNRKSTVQKHFISLDIKETGDYTFSVHQVDKMFYFDSKKPYDYKYIRVSIVDMKRGTEEVDLIDCKFEQGRNLDLQLVSIKDGCYIATVEVYKQSEHEDDIKLVFSTYGPKKTEIKFFNMPLSKDQETALIINPYYCTPSKISEKVVWCEFIRQHLDGLFQHRQTFTLKSQEKEVVEINYYEFTKLEDEEPTPFRYGGNQVSEKRKAMVVKQKQLMETFWKYGIEAIEKWTVDDIVQKDNGQKEKDLIAQYSSNTAFENKNAQYQEGAEESLFDWSGLAYENINQMGELSEIMRYTKQRYDAGFKICEVVMVHLRNPMPTAEGFIRPHM